MQFLQRFSRGQFSLTRTEAFSDAVFAIIVTPLLPKFVSWQKPSCP